MNNCKTAVLPEYLYYNFLDMITFSKYSAFFD